MNSIKNVSADQLKFLAFMQRCTETTPSLGRRINKCIDIMGGTDTPGIIPQSTGNLPEIREKHNPALTAEFLSLFGAASGLKFLTHEFDPNSDMKVRDIVAKAEEVLTSKQFNHQIPSSLYSLMNGFLNGPFWTDFNGGKHENYLNSSQIKEFAKKFPSLHPIASNDFGDEIQSFRNTVRIQKPRLYELFKNIKTKRSQLKGLNLDLDSSGLDKADFYTNVFIFYSVLAPRVLGDIVQREADARVDIKYKRSVWNEYRLHEIRFTHVESEANSFEEVRSKFLKGQGALYEMLNFCCGYCDWTIEGNFEGEAKRWRILDYRKRPEVENLPINEVDGFSHIFTFYKYQ